MSLLAGIFNTEAQRHFISNRILNFFRSVPACGALKSRKNEMINFMQQHRVLAAVGATFVFFIAICCRDAAEPGRPVNRLAKETSPYLQQHGHNPVDWYPWGKEALEKAKREGRVIFLSIGYSSCHWCHVMERESFEDAEIAKYLNEHFVCIKVDREERPDIDAIYMAALSVYN